MTAYVYDITQGMAAQMSLPLIGWDRLFLLGDLITSASYNDEKQLRSTYILYICIYSITESEDNLENHGKEVRSNGARRAQRIRAAGGVGGGHVLKPSLGISYRFRW